MATSACIDKLDSLVQYLDNLTERAGIGELQEQLAALDVNIKDVSDHLRFGDKNYLRNLVREGPWYHLLVICWRSGQRSPIHNHAGSTCGLRILDGVATETRFEITPSELIKAVNSNDMSCGRDGGHAG